MKLHVLTCAVVCIASLFSAAPSAQADEYPSRPIKIVVPFPAGGPSDILARLTAQALSNRLPQAVLVENIPGGSGAIGGQAVAQSEPDGYTLLQFDITQVLLPNMRSDMPYDWQKAFTPIHGLHELPMLLVTSSNSGIDTVQKLVDAGKADSIAYGSGGNGTLSHILAARLGQLTGLTSTHIPYKGLAAAVTAVSVGSEVKYAFVSPSEALSFIRSGTIKALATTGAERFSMFPDVPTLAEQGVDLKATLWVNSYVVPAGTPDDVIQKLRVVIAEALKDPQVQDRAATLGMSLSEKQGADLKAFMEKEMAFWGDVVRSNNITLER